jgi:hypothetical protein
MQLLLLGALGEVYEMIDADGAAQPLFATAEEREQAARGLGVHLDVLPAPGVALGAAEAALVIDGPPVLTDAEWQVIQPVLDQWKGIKLSRVMGREFIDLCLRTARLNFRWTLLDSEPDCEACRKRAERMYLAAGNRWAELSDAVGEAMRPEVFQLLRAWKLHGNGVRDRVMARREKARRDLLTKANTQN